VEFAHPVVGVVEELITGVERDGMEERALEGLAGIVQFLRDDERDERPSALT